MAQRPSVKEGQIELMIEAALAGHYLGPLEPAETESGGYQGPLQLLWADGAGMGSAGYFGYQASAPAIAGNSR